MIALLHSFRVTPSELIFERNEWHKAQTVTFTATADEDHENEIARFHVSRRAFGGSNTYNTRQVEFTVRDYDTAWLVSTDEVKVNRDGTVATLRAKLDERTVGAVTVDAVVLGRDDLMVSPSRLTLGAFVTGIDGRIFSISVPASANPGSASLLLKPSTALIEDESL